MEKDISKKTGVMLLLVGIVVAVAFTIFILNYIQTPIVLEGPSESDSSGDVTLTITKSPQVKDESSGEVILELLPQRGKEW